MLLGDLPLVGQWTQLQNLAEQVLAPAFGGVALLLAMGAAQSLMFTGLAHMGTYALYAAVNALAVAWHLRQVGRRPG